MILLAPVWLLLLIPIVALLVVYLLIQRRRSRYAVRFATLPMLEQLIGRRPGWRRHLPAALLLVAFAVLALAAARPQVDVRVPRERATVMVVVDVSLSMMATDVEPSRLVAARQAAARFIDGLPDGFNVGVVSFAGSATVLDRPGPDHEAAVQSLNALRLGQGTAIGEGVFSSLDQLSALSSELGGDAVPAQIVLLSDGSSTFGRSLTQAAGAATEAGVPVSTIAYGTSQGTVTVQGTTVKVPVDEAALATLADNTRGTAYTAATSDQLDQVYDDIQSSIGYRTELREVTSYVAGAALLIGLLAAFFSMLWFSRLP